MTEAALAARLACDRTEPDLALVFVTADAWETSREVLLRARQVTGARAVVGCSGTGVLTERREEEDGPAAAVLTVADPELVATPFLVEGPADAGAVELLAAQVEPTVAGGGCLIVLPDPSGLSPRTLLDGIGRRLGPVPMLGAVPAGRPVFQLYDTEPRRESLVGVALAGRRPVVGVAQGCMPIGEPYVITRADRNLVLEIGSRRALDVLREAVTATPGGVERVARAGLFAGIAIDAAKSPLGRGDFLVRSLLGVDDATGAVALNEVVRVGQTLQFQIRDAAASREDLEEMLGDVARRLDGRRPRYGCYFNCAGRGRGLFGVRDHDVGVIRERLGPFPLVGFFGNGEFAPVGGRNFLHTYTAVLALFP